MSLTESNTLRFKHTQATKKNIEKRDTLKEKIDGGTATNAHVDEYHTLLQTIRTENQQTKSAMTTFEEIAYDMGKKHDVGSAAFFRPFTPKGAAQWIEAIFIADWTNPSRPVRTGAMATAASSIAAAVTPYYEKLFATKTIDLDAAEECWNTLRTGDRVHPPTADRCSASLTPEEATQTCNRLPTGKAPGPDRIPNKFYKTFSARVGPIIAKVVNESRSKGVFPPGFSSGIITLLYKRKERDDPRNYRPITLPNGDYKIMMRVLATRMNEAVVQCASPGQTGFVPEALLAENIMLLKLIQAHVEDEDSDAYFLYLDMEKAFDRCSWEFLIKAMKEIGLDDGFINFITLAYSTSSPPQRQIYVNGYLGPEFALGSGVAQGCPISPLLFLLITEPMSRLMKNKSEIQGVTINGIRHVMSQFADDSVAINRPGDAPHVDSVMHTWQRGTAMAENTTKREGQLLGKLNRERARAPIGVIENDAWLADGDTIRALGCPMGNDFDETAWWLGRYRTVKSRIASWHHIGSLTITGRNLLLQAIYYGSFRFWLYFMVMPKVVLELLESDSKEIQWASNPALCSNEEGTSKNPTGGYVRWLAINPLSKEALA